MSINTGHAQDGVLVHQGEMINIYAKDVCLSFSGSDDLKSGDKRGRAYLTSHRIIFLVDVKPNSNGPSASSPSEFQSFSFPFHALSEVDVEQPIFSPNALRGKVRAQNDGGWRGEAKFKLVFYQGGAVDFSYELLKALRLIQDMRDLPGDWDLPPPSYSDLEEQIIQEAPPNYYDTTTNPTQSNNFSTPEPGSIFLSQNPPPYPGIADSEGLRRRQVN